jgi:hypothetical protein
MAGLVPAIHVLLDCSNHKDVDARDKPGHDEFGRCVNTQKGPGKTGALSRPAPNKNQRE